MLWFRELPSGTLDLTRAHPAGSAKLFSAGSVRLDDLFREPAALADATRRARVIRGKARELAEERGVSTCFLAIGMATWDRPGAEHPPAAPVLLRRCDIVATPGHPDRLTLQLGERSEFNSVLAKYLEVEHGLDLDVDKINEYANSTTQFDTSKMFIAIRRACATVPGFRVDRRYVVSSFTHTKLPMVRDLSDQLGQLHENHVVAALAGDPEAIEHVAADAPPFVEGDVTSEHLVLDADSSQEDVIQAVRAGAHLVVKGPPGTGKSQTIANLIATIAADGRRVLFVAEKRAAIDAVVRRLDQAGLHDLVLDVRDGRAERHTVVDQFVEQLNRSGVTPPAQPVDQSVLLSARNRLGAHRRAMHDPRPPWGVSVDEAQTRITELNALRPAPRSRAWITPDDLESISEARRIELSEALVEVAGLNAWPTDGRKDPWYGARVVGIQQAERTRDLVAELAEGRLASHLSVVKQLCDQVGLPPGATMLEVEHRLELMADAYKTLESFRPEVFEAPLDELVLATGSGAYRKGQDAHLGAVERRRLRKNARALLRPGQPPADLHGVLVLAASQRARWREVAGKGSHPSAPVELSAVAAAHERLRTDLEWLGERLAGTAGKGDLLSTDFTELQARLDELAAAADRLALVPSVIGKLDYLRANGLGDLLDDLATRRVAADAVADEFEFVWWRAVLARIAETDREYGDVTGDALRRLVADYSATDAQHVELGAAGVRAAVAAQVRRVTHDLPEQTKLLLEQRDSASPLELRELLPAAPELLTALKPCWAMSPLVVASLMPPGLWFDVVVFDEASQIPPAEAISAISRAGQVVVVGDPRQLPPTRIRSGADIDDVEVPGGESVLDALIPLLPGRELTWHYRALDERLIAFANAHVYRGSMVTFPGVGDDAVVRLDVVDGASVDGESADAEVDRVVQVVLDQARQRPRESIGVITLSQRHADRIESAVRAAVTAAPDLARLMDDHRSEPFFVKDLERVQGDERDAVILSVGYGRTTQGELLHRFGAVSDGGGERRLNVAITRARRRMTVVATFSGDELHPAQLRSRGGLMLRDFLLYAASGGAARRVPAMAQTPAAFAPGAPASGAASPSAASPDSAGPTGAGSGDSGSDATVVEDATVASGSGSAPASGATTAPANGGTTGRGAKDDRPSVVRRGPDGRRRRVASTGSVLDRPVLPQTNVGPVPPLVLDLARRLRAEGLIVHPGWGTSVHRLDLAVEDPRRPGSLLVAIETDGPVYGSISATRDRERLRVEQLRRLGWAHERVWTRDLYRDPAREVARLVAAVHAASVARRDAEAADRAATNPWLDRR